MFMLLTLLGSSKERSALLLGIPLSVLLVLAVLVILAVELERVSS